MVLNMNKRLLKTCVNIVLAFVFVYLVMGEITRMYARQSDDKTTKIVKVFESQLIDNRLEDAKLPGSRRIGESGLKRPVVIQRDESFDYKAAMKKLNEEKVAADDPRLVELIRNYYIVPPSTLTYNLTEPDRMDASTGQAAYVDSKFNYREGGFFVECGAMDGERSSNTLLFERFRKWNGILIEADPINFEQLVSKHRKAYAINACLNVVPHPATVTFRQEAQLGKIMNGPTKDKSTTVQCFPLYSILLALNQLNVDFLSLDVEGDELNVLQTIPYDKMNISMMTIEYGHQNSGIMALRRFLEGKGYETLLQMTSHTWALYDVLFMKKGMKYFLVSLALSIRNIARPFP